MLYSKDTWKYLGFIFNRKLLFHQHIDFYFNKVISTVKCMKILGNSVRGLVPHQKYLLYKSYILLIALYGFQLWYYNKAPLSCPLKMLGKIQRKAAIWILGAFKTFPSSSIEAIVGLIPINLHLQKLSERSQLRSHSLPYNHILQSLMEPKTLSLPKLHLLLLSSLAKYQRELIKCPVLWQPLDKCPIVAQAINLLGRYLVENTSCVMLLSQIRYSLVVILELNGVSEVQYKDVMMTDDGKYQ